MSQDLTRAVADQGAHVPQPGKRQLVLDAAREIFLDLGFAGAGMDLIAERAGVSKGTLYTDFDGKHALFECLLGQEASRVARAIPVIDRTESDPSLALQRAGASIMKIGETPSTLAVLRLVIGAHSYFRHLAEAFLNAALGQTVNQLAAYLVERPGADGLGIFGAEDVVRRFARRCLLSGLEYLLVSSHDLTVADLFARAAHVIEEATQILPAVAQPP